MHQTHISEQCQGRSEPGSSSRSFCSLQLCSHLCVRTCKVLSAAMIAHRCSKHGRQKGNWQFWSPDRHNSWSGAPGKLCLPGRFVGGVYVILQAAWELCGLCIDDQMQIVPRGHSLFSPNFTAWHTQGQAGGSALTV